MIIWSYYHINNQIVDFNAISAVSHILFRLASYVGVKDDTDTAYSSYEYKNKVFALKSIVLLLWKVF